MTKETILPTLLLSELSLIEEKEQHESEELYSRIPSCSPIVE